MIKVRWATACVELPFQIPTPQKPQPTLVSLMVIPSTHQTTMTETDRPNRTPAIHSVRSVLAPFVAMPFVPSSVLAPIWIFHDISVLPGVRLPVPVFEPLTSPEEKTSKTSHGGDAAMVRPVTVRVWCFSRRCFQALTKSWAALCCLYRKGRHKPIHLKTLAVCECPFHECRCAVSSMFHSISTVTPNGLYTNDWLREQ